MILLQTNIDDAPLIPIPELTLFDWMIIGVIIIIALVSAAVVVWAIWHFLIKRKARDPYKDRYGELISLCNNNCPDVIKEKDFFLAPDELHAGVRKGIITGYNLIKLNKAIYDVIVYRPNIFNIFNPASWFVSSRIALMSSEKVVDDKGKILRDSKNRPVYCWHSPLMGAVSWYTIGTERIGFLEYAINDVNLDPKKTVDEVKNQTGFQQAINTMKDLGLIVEESLTANPDLRSKQKLQEEIVIPKR